MTSPMSDYPRFEKIMNHWGYLWEAHQVQTEDNYILTIFHILNSHAEPIASES